MDTGVQKAVAGLNAECLDNCTLNIDGSRESKKPGIQKAILVWVLEIPARLTVRAIIRRG